VFSIVNRGIPKVHNFKFIKLPHWLPIFKKQLVLPVLCFWYKVEVFHFPDVWGSIIPPAKKTIITFHDLAPDSSYPNWNQSLRFFTMKIINYTIRKITLNYASRIITISQSIKNEYEKKYGKDNRIVVVYEGVSKEFRNYKNKKRKFFLAFADFSPRKNIFGVVGAYNLFLRNISSTNNFPKLKIIASTFYPRSEIFKICKNFGIEKKVEIEIGVSNNRLVKIYNQSIALLYPSFYEGFGLPILEAFACGCPVITTNYGATKEISKDAAVLIDPHEPKEIALAMKKIFISNMLSSKLIKNGMLKSRDYNWQKAAKLTLRTYLF
jgi:glycosyltransferase involved in cell wall biosynthesis